MRGNRAIWLCAALLSVGACEDRPKDSNPFDNPAAPKQPPPITEPPKPEGPPEFAIHAEGPKIGWTHILLEKDDGAQKLAAEIAANKQHVAGKTIPIAIHRNAKLAWVTQFTSALAKEGADAFEITTDTRTEFPKTVTFTPESRVSNPASCSVVAKVLEERRNAVWNLKGGTAVKSPKGLAGPDMAMTAENLTRAAKGCDTSDIVFVSADDGVEWGLVYDLAAATQTLEKVTLKTVVLLTENPVAGRPVKL